MVAGPCAVSVWMERVDDHERYGSRHPVLQRGTAIECQRVRGVARRCESVRFLFVNDGSTDGTQDLLESMARTDPDAFGVTSLERNSGKAEAVRRGMLDAVAARAVFAGYWDADLATPLEAFPEFRAVLEVNPRLELVLGSRVRLLGRHVTRDPRRHYLGRVFATFASLVLGLGVYDTQCGAKLFRVTPATRALFAEPFRSSWIFDVEILARLIRQRRGHDHDADLAPVADVLYELPLNRWCDVDGSKVKGRDFVKAPLELLAIHRAYLRRGSGSGSGNVGLASRADRGTEVRGAHGGMAQPTHPPHST